MAVPEPPTDSTGQIEAGVTRTVPRPPAEMLDIPETTAAELLRARFPTIVFSTKQMSTQNSGQLPPSMSDGGNQTICLPASLTDGGTLRSTVSDAAFHDPSQTAASACAGPMSTETAATTSHCTESFTGCSKGPPDEKLSRPTEAGKQGCQSSKVSSASKFWKANKKTLITVGACAGATVAGLVVPHLLIGGLGFGAGGVVAGSTAASIQSLMGGVVVKGGLFATMQSWGAVGIPAAAQSLFAACSGATGLGTTTLLMKDKKKQTCEVCKCSKACKCSEASECSEACKCCEVCKCAGTCKCREACKKSEAACKCNETCKHCETCKCNETCKHSETCKCSEAGKGGEAIKTTSLQGQ